jgi:hypothetical protein
MRGAIGVPLGRLAAVLVLSVAVLGWAVGSVHAHHAVASHDSPDPQAERLTEALLDLNVQYQVGSAAQKPLLLGQLLSAAASRQQYLAQLVEDDPGEVLRVALPAALRAALPPAVKAYVEEEVDVEGVLEVLHEDGHAGSRFFYFLDTAAERLSLHFAADPPELLTGARVRVRGVRVNQTLALGSGKKGSVQTLSSAVPNTFGAQETLVILVNFQDAPSEPFTPDSVRTAFFTTTSDFWLENSYQQTWLAGDVVGWFTTALSSTVCDTSGIATQAQAAASAAGVDLAAYAHHVYAFPQNYSCYFWGRSTVGGSPSQAWINGDFELGVTAPRARRRTGPLALTLAGLWRHDARAEPHRLRVRQYPRHDGRLILGSLQRLPEGAPWLATEEGYEESSAEGGLS